MHNDKLSRCGWLTNDPQYIEYHDNVWGRPVTDSKTLFAKLCLDGQQAGLSWLTILKKQASYEAAFHHFDPHRIVAMTDGELDALMHNKGIVRNRLKIASVVKNARGYLAIEKEMPFTDFIWQFTNHKTIINAWDSLSQVPTATEESKAMSKALKKRGFSFVGETICYAFMQAVGMVNDHETHCHCYASACAEARR
ncbi:DNA-3-methyladenine glycosylase I [Alteromonas halophila]|uniref:DNA-3-methyladenine glycosylase I n=1 Tax=Alteromonas halophila TaxID=516698 RepID=A0A918N252_9ALTE|nr:DNA-3-methyladenine glycosylase I [Alteromonas halophila]GGW96333.1 DNA-3-methyladenine glycosylase I [Alteromonas halophila]